MAACLDTKGGLGLEISSVSETRSCQSSWPFPVPREGGVASPRGIRPGDGKELAMSLPAWWLAPVLASFRSSLLPVEMLVVFLRMVKSVSKILIVCISL